MKLERGNILARSAACAALLALAVAAPNEEARAQQGNAAHTHIGHVLSGFGATPDGAGLLPTALAEAEAAARHAELAAGDPSNLQGMQLHARHVLHAVDPSRIDSGPGQGFGVKRAAEEIARHIELAAGSDGASDAVRTHAAHVAAAARTVARRADEIASVVDEIQDAYDYTEAAGHVERLQTLVRQLTEGADANGDGEVTWQEGEGGLQHVERHMELMASAEGLN